VTRSHSAAAPAARAAPHHEAFLPAFLKLSAVQPGERVLDIAPGTGVATVEAARRAGAGGEVLAIAPDPAALEAVAAHARAAGVTWLRTAPMDPARLELPDAYWDVVLCHFGLADMPDPDAVLREVCRVMRPVARLGVATLGTRDRCPLITIFTEVVGAHLPAVKGQEVALFRHAEPGRLAGLLAAHGFEDAVPERLTAWVPFRDVDDYWQTLTATTRFGAAARDLPAETVAACQAEIARRTRFYRRGGGIELKVEAIILAAVR
jgi:ubiquinone/menaquinone biosynthesis C-methylase UbiE